MALFHLRVEYCAYLGYYDVKFDWYLAEFAAVSSDFQFYSVLTMTVDSCPYDVIVVVAAGEETNFEADIVVKSKKSIGLTKGNFTEFCLKVSPQLEPLSDRRDIARTDANVQLVEVW